MTPAEESTPGWRELFSSRHFPQIVLLAFGVWLHAADELMVSTITPVMVEAIGGELYVAWLIALYEIGSILAGACGALIVLRIGVRPAMSIAALTYFVGCVISGIAPEMLVMLAGRLVQGLGGGAMIAIAFVAVHQIIPSRMTVRAYAIFSMVWGVSAFSGPMIGAIFAQGGFWREAFFFYALQAVVFAAVIWIRFPKSRPSGENLPPESKARPAQLALRLLLLAGGVTSIAYAGIAGGIFGAIICVAGGFALLTGFVRLDGQARNGRMLPLEPWRLGTPQGAVLMLVITMSASTAGLITYGPLILDRVHAVSPIAIGAILLLESVGWSVVAISLSSVRPHQEPFVIAAGFSTAFAGTIVVFLFIANGPVWLVALGAVMMGGGFGAGWAPMVRRATSLSPKGEAERIAAAIPTVQRLGYALGAALTGIAANASGFADSQSIETATRSADWIFGLLLLPGIAGMIAVSRFVRFKESGPKVKASFDSR